MCVVALAYKAHPRWQLVLAGNRDEIHARAASPVAHWSDAPEVIAGRDLVAGGSWLGVSETGSLAVVTNVRSDTPPDPSRASRGALISDLLRSEGRYANPDVADLDDFNAFNLLLANPHEAYLLSNRPMAMRIRLSEGVHALSNGMMGEAWPRKDRLAEAMETWLEVGAVEPESLFELLIDETPLADGAPLFIRDEFYGTRCSTVVAIDSAGRGLITERRYASGGALSGETEFVFDWPRRF